MAHKIESGGRIGIGELAEGRRLGVDAMRAADRGSYLVLKRATLERDEALVEIGDA